MTRPRTVSDEELLLAASRAVCSVGPARLTLAHVAKEASVSPATLMQRFGSKRRLLLALVQMGGSAADSQMASLRADNPSPLMAIHAFAQCMAGMAASPEELANHLAFLVMDLTDPEFRKHTLAQAQVFQAELESMFQDAVAAGELLACPCDKLARLFQEVLHGALVTWAIVREGSAADFVRRETDSLLAPYLPPSKRKRKSTAKDRKKRR